MLQRSGGERNPLTKHILLPKKPSIPNSVSWLKLSGDEYNSSNHSRVSLASISLIVSLMVVNITAPAIYARAEFIMEYGIYYAEINAVKASFFIAAPEVKRELAIRNSPALLPSVTRVPRLWST